MAKGTASAGADVTIHVWYDDTQNVIKMRIPAKRGKLTSVWPDPARKRGNPDLFKKLAAVLRDDGKKYPAGVL